MKYTVDDSAEQADLSAQSTPRRIAVLNSANLLDGLAHDVGVDCVLDQEAAADMLGKVILPTPSFGMPPII